MSIALGELVKREVGRRARRSASDGDWVRAGLKDAREVAAELASVIVRLEHAAEPNHRPERSLEPVTYGKQRTLAEETSNAP